MSIPGSVSPLFFQTAAGAAAAAGPIKSVRFNADDTSKLSRTPSSAGSQQKFTLSTWVKRCRGGNASATEILLAIDAAFGIYFYDDKIYVDLYAADLSSWYVQTITDAKFRDNSAWYHIVIAVDSTAGSGNDDRIKIWVNGVLQTQAYTVAWGGTITGNMAKVNTAIAHDIGMRGTQYPSSFYLADYYWIDGQAKLPTDFGAFDSNGVWQSANYSGTFGTNGFHLFDFANESGIGSDSSGNDNDFTVVNLTGSIPSIASPSLPTWNGSIGSYWTRSNSNYDADYDGTSIYRAITAALSANTTYHFYLNFKDGGGAYGGWFFSSTSTAPSNTVPDELGGNSLGLRTGESYLGTYGTYATANSTSNGQDKINVSALNSQSSGEYNIEFVVNTAAGKVWAKKPSDSGYVGGGDPTNSSSTASFLIPTGAQYFGYMGHSTNTFANFKTYAGNLADLDVLHDVPVNGTQSDTGAGGEVSGNYCTLNPLDTSIYSGSVTITDGNLEYSGTNSSAGVKGTIFVSSGKWYWECTLSSGSSDAHVGIGGAAAIYYPGYSSNSYAYDQTGKKRTSDTASNYGATYASGDIIGVALDLDNGTLAFYKNGSSQGTAFTGLIGTFAPQVGNSVTNTSSSWILNCGQRAFNTAAPAGFKALCTTNLPTPTVADGSDYFDTKLYTGNSSTQSITGYSFEPDLVWIKSRGPTARQHMLYDQIRGVGKHLLTDGSEAEYTNANGLTHFNSDGFSLGNIAEVNELNASYVAWAWNAGSSATNNTNGSLNSSAYDQSQTWSTAGTITNSSTIANAFDGNLSSYWGANANTVSRYTFPSVYTGTKFELRLDVSLANTNFNVNGQTSNSVTGAIPAITWVDVTDAVLASNLGGLSYIEVGYVPSVYSTSIYAVRIDGKMLVDSGISPTNVPSIGSTVRASQTAGISIVSYTGSGSSGTVGHGLNAEPDMIIVKDINSAQNWKVLHSAAVTSSYSKHYQNLTWLNSNSPTTSTGTGNAYPWNNSPPTPFVFSVSNSASNTSASQSGVNYIAYCFSSVKNFSQFGSYVGDGVANSGPFVFTSFRPAFLMIKGVDGGDHWYMYDSKRDGYNPDNEQLTADINHTEYAASSYPSIDFLSNGFKVRSGNNAGRNQSGITYMYMCFAENPFQANGGLAR